MARWIKGDLTVAELEPDAAIGSWRIVPGTGGLERFGISLDGRHVCTVGADWEMQVRSVTTTVSFSTSERLGEFETDGCIVNRQTSVLTFWRAGSRIRTFILDSGVLTQGAEAVFDGGMLGGPASVLASSAMDVAIVSSPFGRVETWRSADATWQRQAAFEEPELISLSPGVGGHVVVIALSQVPQIIVLRLADDGGIASTSRLETSEIVGKPTVSPDDRYAWVWGPRSGYVIDLEKMSVDTDERLSDCDRISPVAVETTSGYALVGVRSQDGRRHISMCRLGDDGRLESIESAVAAPDGYGDDDVLSVHAVFR